MNNPLENISKNVSFKLSDIDYDKWINRLFNDSEYFVSDLNKLKKIFRNYSDKPIVDGNGIVGEWLFPLNLSLKYSSIAVRDVSFDNLVQKGYFVSFCPELETFITIIFWMQSDSKILKMFKEIYQNKDKNLYLTVSGNYRLGGKMWKQNRQTYAKVTHFGDSFGQVSLESIDK